jgi:AP-1 complex subunit gamma-1
VTGEILTRLRQTTLVDLMGDEIATATAPSNGTVAPPVGANEDLLSQIFGGGAATNAGLAPSAPATKKKAIDDILGLFGPGGGAAAQPIASPASAPSLASLFSQPAAPARAPAPAPAPVAAAQPPAPQQAQGYTAYEKNGLKASLRPQVSASRPGVVLITARFEATGAASVTGINFQAAVPKVCPALD